MSADGKSFTFKGVDYGGASYNVYAKLADFPRLPRPRVTVDNYAQADGAATQGSTFDPITLTLECALVGTSVSNVETLAANVAAALAASQVGPGALVLDSHPTKSYTARLTSAIDGMLGLNGEKFTLEFLCADPWPAATSATTGSAANDGGGTTTA